MVSDGDDKWRERIFVTYIENSFYPVITVGPDVCHERNFKDGNTFMITAWRYWKPLPEKKVIEVTLEDVAKKYEVDEVKIVEKK